jgi:senataxin
LKENRVQFSDIKNHLRSGRMLACHFRLSTNYFYLKPGECYEFDETKAYIHPISDMPASHAVMGTGFGVLPSVSRGKQLAHVTMQNSEGLRFGYDGSGTVMRQSLRGAYTMCPEEDMCITTNKQSTSGAQQKE